MRIGKILIDSDHDTHEAKVVYAKFPEDIAKRKVLLMYPIMSKLKKKIMYPGFVFHFSINSTGTGNTVVKAVSVLKDHSVLEVILLFPLSFRSHKTKLLSQENIILANLFCTPPATQTIVTAFPQVN